MFEVINLTDLDQGLPGLPYHASFAATSVSSTLEHDVSQLPAVVVTFMREVSDCSTEDHQSFMSFECAGCEVSSNYARRSPSEGFKTFWQNHAS